MVRKGESSTRALLRTLADTVRRRAGRVVAMNDEAKARRLQRRRPSGTAIRRDDYARSHSLEGRRGRGARRRAPPDHIDFVPPSLPYRHHTPALSASDLECSPLEPTGHLRQKLRLNDTTPQFKMPGVGSHLSRTRRSLMDSPA
ncbi:hypothetical protein ACJJTC_009539 [Scirpophaga incertulas]